MNPLAGAFEGGALLSPQWLLLLAPAAAIALTLALRSHPAAIGWPALAEARAAGAGRGACERGVAGILRALALAALACVVAGPVAVHRAPPEPGFGLDLVLVLDASGSMGAIDTRVGGQLRSRLALARQVVARFAASRAAAGDRVGLVVFGSSAFTACPLTSDGRLLAAALDRIQVGVAGEATALGDALALATKRALAAGGAGEGAEPVAGRVVVLLTDGRSNAGSLSLDVATALARGEGVRVHTVGVGSTAAGAPVEISVGDRVGLDFERHEVDRAALTRIAARTGGRYFAARRADELAVVYRDIDALERVARRLPPRIRQTDRPEPLLALAGCCLLAEIGVTRVLRRELP